ncbi:hypothetical protein NMY22_g11630 [Coprinellus aureogranulatus]|nr:hypothetical protein NMY22_g11630 [Coprinellus aureogranulatus]
MISFVFEAETETQQRTRRKEGKERVTDDDERRRRKRWDGWNDQLIGLRYAPLWEKARRVPVGTREGGASDPGSGVSEAESDFGWRSIGIGWLLSNFHVAEWLDFVFQGFLFSSFPLVFSSTFTWHPDTSLTLRSLPCLWSPLYPLRRRYHSTFSAFGILSWASAQRPSLPGAGTLRVIQPVED